MDAQTLQFALFLGIAAALYTLVTVGLEIARRFSLQSRATGTVAVGADIAHHRND